MKKFLMCCVLVFSAMITFVACAAKVYDDNQTLYVFGMHSLAINSNNVGGNMQSYNAKFVRGGFFGVFEKHEAPPYFIIRTAAEMEKHIEAIMANFKTIETAQIPENYWEELENQVRGFYLDFNNDFFANNFLIVALVAQGSGSFRYELVSLSLSDSILTIEITHNNPFIQTMDFVATTLFLELPTAEYDVNSVKINVSP